jgi:hypothetical protein
VVVSGIVVHADLGTAVDDRSLRGAALDGSERFLRRLRPLANFFIAKIKVAASVATITLFLSRQ